MTGKRTTLTKTRGAPASIAARRSEDEMSIPFAWPSPVETPETVSAVESVLSRFCRARLGPLALLADPVWALDAAGRSWTYAASLYSVLRVPGRYGLSLGLLTRNAGKDLTDSPGLVLPEWFAHDGPCFAWTPFAPCCPGREDAEDGWRVRGTRISSLVMREMASLADVEVCLDALGPDSRGRNLVRFRFRVPETEVHGLGALMELKD